MTRRWYEAGGGSVARICSRVEGRDASSSSEEGGDLSLSECASSNATSWLDDSRRGGGIVVTHGRQAQWV
eukprot:COSAG01_NODE_2380_length_7793_cov_118.038602_3_plen_70_part_00